MENKNIVVQSNRILQAKYGDTLTFWESFIVAKMCTMIQPNDEDFKEYKLFVKDLLEFNEVASTGMAYKVVYEATQRLLERKISIRGTDENGRATVVDTHIIAGVERLVEPQKGDDAYFKLIFVPKLKPYLLQLKRDFSVMQLADYKNLHTHTAIRIYELLVSYFGRGQRVVSVEVDELKEMLGLKGKYDRFEAFKRRILDDAQKRLADSTDYSFAYSVKKKGRAPHSVEFTISRNKPAERNPKAAKTAAQNTEFIEVEHTSNESHERLFEELHPQLKGWGVGVSAFMKLIEAHSEAKIRTGLKAAKQAELSGKVQNLGGFFVQAVKEGYVTNDDAKKQKQSAVAEKQQTERAKEATEKAKIEQAKKDRYQKERAAFLTLVRENPARVVEILEAGKMGGPIRESTVAKYDRTRSFEENLAEGGVLLATTMQAIAKELWPEKFDFAQ